MLSHCEVASSFRLPEASLDMTPAATRLEVPVHTRPREPSEQSNSQWGCQCHVRDACICDVMRQVTRCSTHAATKYSEPQLFPAFPRKGRQQTTKKTPTGGAHPMNATEGSRTNYKANPGRPCEILRAQIVSSATKQPGRPIFQSDIKRNPRGPCSSVF